MKYRIVSIFGLFVASAFLFSACTKSDIEKSQESYDWSKVQPMIIDFAGPTLVSASGQVASNYSVAGRGGSTYEFTAHNWSANIEIDPEFNFKATQQQLNQAVAAKSGQQAMPAQKPVKVKRATGRV